MEPDDDTFRLPPDGPVSEGEGDTHVLPPEIEPLLGDGCGALRRRPRPPGQCGSLGVWLYRADPGYEPASSSAAGPIPFWGPAARVRVVGVGVVRWEFLAGAAGEAGEPGANDALRRLSASMARS